MNTLGRLRYKTHRALPVFCASLGITPLLLSARHLLGSGEYIRAIFYHHTTAQDAITFERHLQYLSEHFVNVSYFEMSDFLRTGHWKKERPGVLISFDDGMESNYSVAAPLLEKYGFTGWYFAPADFIDCPPAEQVTFAQTHRMLSPEQPYELGPEGRLALSWAELRDLIKRGHTVGCHTRTHRRMSLGLPDDVLRAEICGAKSAMEGALGFRCDCFCWVGGEEPTYTAAAAAYIRGANFSYSFTTLSAPITAKSDPYCLPRVGLSADWSLAQLTFEISGIQDLLYAARRRRVHRLLSSSPAHTKGICHDL